MLKAPATSVACFATVLIATGCGGPRDTASLDAGEGTARMVRRLAELATNVDPEQNEYVNSLRVRHLLSKTAPEDPRERLLFQANLAHEFLLAGETEEAIRRLRELQRRMAERAELRDPGIEHAVGTYLGVAYLRLGEQQNCLERHNVDSCLLPIRDSGVHTLKDGSRQAIREFADALRREPGDLNSRWLLNIAHMTIGEYPDSVPAEWLMPPELFEAAYELPRFYDVAGGLGVDTVGLSGGSVMEDMDGDGYLDLMASSWGLGDQLRYFKNEGDGTFSDRTLEAGLLGITGGLNLVHADYDNDGNADVLVLRGAWRRRAGRLPNSLLRNNGDGTFADVTEAAGLLTFRPTQTAAWADYDNDGWLDLFIGNESVQQKFPCELYHNNGDGTFAEVSAEAGIRVEAYVKGVTWGDYDNDGLADLYVSVLDDSNLLFHNEGRDGRRWRFREVAGQAGVDDPTVSFPVWFWDYDNDGWLDLFVSGYGGSWVGGTAGDVAADYLGLPHRAETPRLYHNSGDGTFTDVTKNAGLDQVLFTMGSNYGDLDNDGWPDFYVGTGEPDLRALMPNRMFRNAGGRRFQDVTASGGFGHLQKGHGVAFGDLDNDGDQDIFAVIGGAYEGDVFQNALFENPGTGNHWITLKLVGTRSNAAGIGARIEITVETPGGPRTIHALVGTGGSFGSSSLRQEIGLGDAKAIRHLEIRWPASGQIQRFPDVSLDASYAVSEGGDRLEPLSLAPLSLSSPSREHAH